MVRKKNAELTAEKNQLQDKLRTITTNAFLSSDRVGSAGKMKTIEEERNKLRIDVETLRAEKSELEIRHTKVAAEAKTSTDKYAALVEANQRLQINFDDKDRKHRELMEQLKFLQEGLPSADRQAIEQALNNVLKDRAGAFLRVDLLDRAPGRPSS